MFFDGDNWWSDLKLDLKAKDLLGFKPASCGAAKVGGRERGEQWGEEIRIPGLTRRTNRAGLHCPTSRTTAELGLRDGRESGAGFQHRLLVRSLMPLVSLRPASGTHHVGIPNLAFIARPPPQLFPRCMWSALIIEWNGESGVYTCVKSWQLSWRQRRLSCLGQWLLSVPGCGGASIYSTQSLLPLPPSPPPPTFGSVSASCEEGWPAN